MAVFAAGRRPSPEGERGLTDKGKGGNFVDSEYYGDACRIYR